MSLSGEGENGEEWSLAPLLIFRPVRLFSGITSTGLQFTSFPCESDSSSMLVEASQPADLAPSSFVRSSQRSRRSLRQ